MRAWKAVTELRLAGDKPTEQCKQARVDQKRRAFVKLQNRAPIIESFQSPKDPVKPPDLSATSESSYRMEGHTTPCPSLPGFEF